MWTLSFERVKATPKKLEAFHEKIASLRILDPACGCGNFLITTYKELRSLELEIIKMKYPSRQRLLDVSPLIKVSIDQFYGLEILDFPCEVARTGMWLVEHLMNREVGEWFGMAYADLPLKRSAHIIQGNALRLDWQELLKDDVKYAENLRFDYIIGNPPYIGARYMSAEQKDDLNKVFGNQKNAGNLDYVTCWVKRASDYMTYALHTRTAFVMTNSVTQGETPANLWQPLFDQGLHIDYAWRTFKWWNEGRGKAAVHCVIVGFSKSKDVPDKYILNEHSVITRGKETKQTVRQSCRQINAYLVDAPCVSVMSRPKPLCDIPEIGIGNKPIDDGNYLFLDSEKEEFVRIEPASEKYFKRWYGSVEFINNRPRWCLWLGDCEPGDLRKMPECLKRVQAVRAFRLDSKSEGTRKLAEKPTRFHVENMPKDDYLLIPRVSSEKRNYIPIGYIKTGNLCSDSVHITTDATLYHFGILTSSVHMAWVRAVCGRLKSDYRYSKDIVYNNFPWPDLNGANGIDCAKRKAKESDEDYKKRMEAKISLCAEEILCARDNHPDSSLADLYDPLTMPPDLLKAHKALDKAVMELYGYTPDMSEPEIVADLMTRYQKLIDAEKSKISLAREEFENASDVSQKAIPKRTRKRKTEA
ncbi:MAG: class I SAM-dependent DNA methyltransferase [Proteobacteria bacterium]|nr:class I SAM-dependent DNA methyltransferase [Pseudomonadota bacterium]